MAKALVAYFSASGVTKKLSENLAGAIGADDGKRFKANASAEELKDWASEWI